MIESVGNEPLFNTPPGSSPYLTKSEKPTQVMMSNSSQWLGKDISKVVRRGNLINNDIPIHDAFPYVVVLDVDVLNLGVVFHVPHKCNGTHTVTV